ncbi:MAG: VWA domain-containing protein [Sedimentisphaerales bacterium]|nr:VWA domain-containing protein [Sedimentisphaerales bacterium]
MKKAALLTAFLLWMYSGLTVANSCDGNQLKLEAAVSHPVLLADKQQTAYLRVGLTGFAMDKSSGRAPVNVAIVIDKSGSMSGAKIEQAKEAAIKAVCRLHSEDIVSVVTYDSTVTVVVPATKVSDKDTILAKIRSIQAGGSTALYAGVEKGAQEMRKFLSDNRVNRMVLLSDGLANVGPSSPTDLARLGEKLIKEGISVTTIGIGLGYNEDLMTQLAYKSDGSHYFAEKVDDLAKVFEQEFGRSLSVVAQEVQIDIRCAKGIRPVRLLGREGKIDGQDVSVFINQIYSNHERYVILEVEMPASPDGRICQLAEVKVRYDNMRTRLTDRLSCELQVRFSNSAARVEEHINQVVMADVIRQIATERNELAVTLRDQGKVEEARQMLEMNTKYLYENAVRYNCEQLRDYGMANEYDAQNLDEMNWGRQRKIMRSVQSDNRRQR